MTKQQTITQDAASAVILQVPLDTLSISELNPRKSVSEAHIESLADSIERFGLIHNLAGLMDADGNVGIVAGGCRLRAIQLIAERSKDHPFATVPVKLASNAAEGNRPRLCRYRSPRLSAAGAGWIARPCDGRACGWRDQPWDCQGLHPVR